MTLWMGNDQGDPAKKGTLQQPIHTVGGVVISLFLHVVVETQTADRQRGHQRDVAPSAGTSFGVFCFSGFAEKLCDPSPPRIRSHTQLCG